MRSAPNFFSRFLRGKRMILQVEQDKGGKDRFAMLEFDLEFPFLRPDPHVLEAGAQKRYTNFRYVRKGLAAACGHGGRFLGTPVAASDAARRRKMTQGGIRVRPPWRPVTG